MGSLKEIVGKMEIQTAHRSDVLRPLRFALLATLILALTAMVTLSSWTGPLFFFHGVLTGVYVGLFVATYRRCPDLLRSETYEGPERDPCKS